MNRYNGFDEKLIFIVHLYARKLFQRKVFRSMDMEDIEQELMLRAINSVKNYNSNLGSIHNFWESVVQKHANKLLSMNSCLKRGGNSVPEELSEDLCANRIDTVDVDKIIDLADLNKAFTFLSADQRTLCELARRYSIQDISRILNVNRTTLYSRLKVILRIIKHIYRSQKQYHPYFLAVGGSMNSISILETLSAKEISALDTADLMDLNDQVINLASQVKTMKEKLDDSLNLRFSEVVKNNLRSEGKDTGTTRFFDGQHQIIAEIPKKVTWDAEKMEQIIKQIPEEKRKSIVKTSYSIDERKYAELSYEYQMLFKDARTVTPGKTRFQISAGGE